MSWIELKLTVNRAQQEQIQSQLESLGALAVTMMDAGDNPILEPGVDETPLWPTLNFTALFDQNTDQSHIMASLSGLDISDERWQAVQDQDWERAWMDDFKAMDFGNGLWIVPHHLQTPASAKTIVRLDPGLAFGSGTHPTTAMCLNELGETDLQDKRVLDFGCGSGILAIAALKLGAANALGIDNDPQALVASQENAAANDVAARLQLAETVDLEAGCADVVVANILAGPLVELSELLANACASDGKLILSGILREQADSLEQCYARWFTAIEIHHRDDWVMICATKR